MERHPRSKKAVDPPGPVSKAFIKSDNEIMSKSLTRSNDLVAKTAHLAFVQDFDDNVYLDFGAGIAVARVGYTHPKVVEIIKHQAEELIFISSLVYYSVPQIDHPERLVMNTPGDFRKRVFFANSLGESIDGVIKYGIRFVVGFNG
jgi:4-aminobutyrate aminotransferase